MSPQAGGSPGFPSVRWDALHQFSAYFFSIWVIKYIQSASANFFASGKDGSFWVCFLMKKLLKHLEQLLLIVVALLSLDFEVIGLSDLDFMTVLVSL